MDALYMNGDGDAFIGSGSFPFAGRLHVNAQRNYTGVHITADSKYLSSVAAFAVSDSSSGIVGNSYRSLAGMTIPTNPAGVAGIGAGPADGGFFAADGTGDGVECWGEGTSTALRAEAVGSGYSGSFKGGAGVAMERDAGYPVLHVRNTSTTGWGDAGWFSSPAGMNANTWTVYATCYEGSAGRFAKYLDDTEYAMTVLGANASSEGLYVQGTIVSTMPIPRMVPTSRGTEAVFGVTAPDVEVMASGSGRLSGGAARVEFDHLFAECIAGAADLRVTATPIGAWSALYVERIDGAGFSLRSDAGDKDVEFHWVAVGRAKGYERAPEIAFPDPEENERIAAEKRAAFDQRRPVEQDGPGVITIRPGEAAAAR